MPLSEFVDDATLRREVLPVPVTPRTTIRWRQRKRNPLPHYKIAGRIVYKRDEVLRWLEKHRVTAGRPRKAQTA